MIVTASCGGLHPLPFCFMYSASKRTWWGVPRHALALIMLLSKLTSFHRRGREFDSFHRETLHSLWRHSGQRYRPGTVRMNLLDPSG
jgi:hypothetical protein